MISLIRNAVFSANRQKEQVFPTWRSPVFVVGAIALLVALAVATLASGLDPYMVLVIPLAVVSAWLLLIHPEISLGIFLVIGGVKAHPSLVALRTPDLTLVFAGVVVLGCILDVVLHKKRLALPPAFLLYLPMALMIPVSLLYTVSFAEGLDKAGRFLILGSISIVAPFLALTSRARLHRFFYVLFAAGLFEVLTAIADPQLAERFSSPSAAPLHLGYYAAVGIVVIMFLVLPKATLLRRLPFYAIFPLLVYGLAGSGVRRSIVAVALCAVLAVCFYPKLVFDFVFLAVGALLILSYVSIPDFSVQYLSTLISQSPQELYSGRSHLLNLGWGMALDHPLLGIGIGAFRFFTPNPSMYDYPHNLLVEIFCEVGIFAAVSILLLQIYCLYVAVKGIFSKLPIRGEMLLALAFLVIGLVDSAVSGDINNVRPMWLAMSLPFIVNMLKENDVTHVRNLRLHR